MTKRGFIRALWGNSYSNFDLNYKIDKEIRDILDNQFNEPFTVYVMGDSNYLKLISTGIEKLGHKVVLISSAPYLFDTATHMHRNKIEVLKYAMEVDKFEEIVFLDWDCLPVKKLPVDFWEEHYKKKPLQCCFAAFYMRCKDICYWRKSRERIIKHLLPSHIVPNGGYIYIGDKTIPSKIAKEWEESTKEVAGDWSSGSIHGKYSIEPAIAKVQDDMIGGWKSLQDHYNNFEPIYCHVRRKNMMRLIKEYRQKDICFYHSV